ncbi:MAG: hypothetical protein MUE44_02775 [Oscillatoriaceae cyanobacterium Prado104]|jgi:hypothetical protein|nr:hypothetical protein [Oscillatoriaceae cyanobacterium Prado104]
MNISDLELLENLSEATVLEGGSYYYPGHKQYDYVNVYASSGIFSAAFILGNTAVGSADAKAYGYNTFSKSATYTVTDPFFSGSSSYSLSATGY